MDFPSLKLALVRSRIGGRPLPVSDQHSENCIYTGKEVNLAFRFWHDMTHLRLDRGFDLDGEIAVAVAHLDVLRAYGFGPGSLEFELLHADTLGQTLCAAATGDFPADQLCFVRHCLETTLSEAIRRHLATVPSERSDP